MSEIAKRIGNQELETKQRWVAEIHCWHFSTTATRDAVDLNSKYCCITVSMCACCWNVHATDMAIYETYYTS